MIKIKKILKYYNAIIFRFIISKSPKKVKYLWAKLPYSKYHKYLKVFFDSEQLVIWKNVKIFINPSTSSDFHIYFFNEYEENNFNQLLKYISEESIFVDVGSNQGLFALPFTNMYKNIKTYSFEPDINASLRQIKNININPELKDKIILETKVVYDRDGFINFYSNNDPYNNQTNRVDENNVNNGSTEVESIRLDTYFKEKLKKPNVVKIDVEGAEYKVLLGMESLFLKGSPQVLFVEIHSLFYDLRKGEELKINIFKLLHKHNYKIYYFYNNEWVLIEIPDKLPELTNIFCIKE